MHKNWHKLSFTQKMDKFIAIFSTMTKEESDYIAEICSWDDEMRSAFMFAKRVFEDKTHAK